MEINIKDLKLIKNKFNKLPRITWIYFQIDDKWSKAWYIKCDEDNSYVLVRYPYGPYKKLIINDEKIYITKDDYNKYIKIKKKKKIVFKIKKTLKKK